VKDSKSRVLIAEDDPDSRLLLQLMFDQEGIGVELVQDGFQALEFLDRETPDVLVTDLHMPGKSGLDLIREIREREVAGHAARPLHIIAMSAGGRDLLRRAQDEGAERAFDKGELPSLVERVKELLQRHLAPRLRPAETFG
jgi:CheY-like chemotaxis protein